MKAPLALVFPGQGSQYVGMARDLLDQFSYTKTVFEEVSDALKIDVAKLCLEGPEDRLQLTANAQPSILTVSFAWYLVLKNERGLEPIAAAGHSLGEYTALLSAGALSLAQAAGLVRRRGELMQDAVPNGVGKMAAVIGLDDSAVRKLCESSTQGTHSLVVAANFNAPGQVVIAGHAGAVERAEISAGDNNSPYRARKVIPLKVSAPFHCPLMKPIAEEFRGGLESIEWKATMFPVVANVHAKVHEREAMVDNLIQQLYSPVLWTQCVSTLTQLGCTTFLEPGPGKVLSGLVKRCAPNGSVVSVDTFDDFKRFGGEG